MEQLLNSRRQEGIALLLLKQQKDHDGQEKNQSELTLYGKSTVADTFHRTQRNWRRFSGPELSICDGSTPERCSRSGVTVC